MPNLLISAESNFFGAAVLFMYIGAREPNGFISCGGAAPFGRPVGIIRRRNAFVIASTIIGFWKWGLVATAYTVIITLVMDHYFWLVGFPVMETYVIGGTINATIAVVFGRLRQTGVERANTDALTGVCNLRSLRQALQWEIGICKRYNRPLSLLMIDLDRFKELNDQRGHQCGDIALRTLSDSVRGCIRDSDLLGRYGGDEFTVILPETPHEGAETIAERICSIVRNQRVECHGQPAETTVSVGLATLRMQDTAETLLHRADEALYNAKALGKDRVSSVPTD